MENLSAEAKLAIANNLKQEIECKKDLIDNLNMIDHHEVKITFDRPGHLDFAKITVKASDFTEEDTEEERLTRTYMEDLKALAGRQIGSLETEFKSMFS